MIARGVAAALVVSLAGAGCSGIGNADFDWFGSSRDRPRAGSALELRWVRRLTGPNEGPYLPVERASATLDPRNDRIYVGSTSGELHVFDAAGREVYDIEANGAIEAAPALDVARHELYVATEDGELLALDARTGEERWKETVGGPIRQSPVLTEDGVFVVTDTDTLAAFSRAEGESLWTFQRDPIEGFSITGHAGLAVADGKVITGFTDGLIVALDPAEGRVLWELDTSLDVEMTEGSASRFLDVDTTPVVSGGIVYAASFAGGLYALALDSGTVRYRDAERTGVVGMVRASGRRLVLASADEGLVCLDLRTRRVIWTTPIERGSPTQPQLAGNVILFGESEGSFRAVTLTDGREVGRLDSGHGFSAPATVAGRLGFVLTNGGTLFAFEL